LFQAATTKTHLTDFYEWDPPDHMGSKSKQPSKTIVLISADAEWLAVKSILPEAQIHNSPLGEWFYAQISSAKVQSAPPDIVSDTIFFHGGWGKIAAAASTQYVIDRWQPDLLINLGTCGGFEGHIERGVILLVEKTIVYDIIEQMGDFDQHIAYYSTDIDLSWLAQDHPKGAQRSLLVSGDRDLVVEELPELHRRYGAIAGDWESGAIAFVAKCNRKRIVILRGVSDLVGSDGSEAYGDLNLFNIAARSILEQLIEELPYWLSAAKNN
jgi:adenosylhomocysteine nucleosidase